MGKGIARVTPNSRTGRSLIRVALEHQPWKISTEVREHNRLVDEKKAAKKAAKVQKNASGV